jgi:aryl-alcohol dehydrogenase-like predicted oxidoreductase
MTLLKKLSIGTAQFGLSYGINNKTGQVPINEVFRIMEYASKNNINYIDTASAYGEAETILGKLDLENFNITTKLVPFTSAEKNIEVWILDKINESLRKLKKENIYALLLHDTNILKGSDGPKILNALQTAKKENLINKIGVSIYDPEELDKMHDFREIDVVQAPFNIFDRRLETSGWIDKLYSENIEVQVRSVFLQGALLKKNYELDSRFNEWRNLFQEFEKFLHCNDLNAYEACISFVGNYEKISQIIVGIDSFDQFRALVNLAQTETKSYNQPDIFCNDLNLIDPRNW